MGSQITKGKQLDIFLKTQLPSKSELWMGSWRAERQQLGSLRDHLPPDVEAHGAGPSQQGDAAGTAGQDPPLSDMEDPTQSDRYQ